MARGKPLPSLACSTLVHTQLPDRLNVGVSYWSFFPLGKSPGRNAQRLYTITCSALKLNLCTFGCAKPVSCVLKDTAALNRPHPAVNTLPAQHTTLCGTALCAHTNRDQTHRHHLALPTAASSNRSLPNTAPARQRCSKHSGRQPAAACVPRVSTMAADLVHLPGCTR